VRISKGDLIYQSLSQVLSGYFIWSKRCINLSMKKVVFYHITVKQHIELFKSGPCVSFIIQYTVCTIIAKGTYTSYTVTSGH
jgi:hypothetical protein